MTFDDFVEADNPTVIRIICCAAHKLPVAVFIMRDNQNRKTFFDDLPCRNCGGVFGISKRP
jgi:hypothetical protein